MKHFYSTIMKLIVSTLVLQLVFTSVNAQWSTDPNVNNAVCTAGGIQISPTITSDGSGGAIISWNDNNTDIYAQRIAENGIIQWTARGIPVCTDGNVQIYQQIASDSSGGAIITWQDYRSGSKYDIYAQRINASGLVQWTSNGVAICTAEDSHITPKIISDGAGGAIIIWQNYFGGGVTDIFAQRINASGAVLWTTDGVAICTATGNQNDPQICSDGAHGAIITWGDDRLPYNGDVYAQRIDANGVVQWASNGVAIATGAGHQRFPQICSDGAAGGLITWVDQYNGNDDIYSQRIASTGALQWGATGVAICQATGLQYYPQIGPDGSGGAIIAWYDYRNGNLNADIYAQRINASGAVQYSAQGVAICTESGHQYAPRIVNDGTSGAIITWYDYRKNSLNPDIYAQKTDENGVVQWTSNGVPICTKSGVQTGPQICIDGLGGAIITWTDNNPDIYAQRISFDGNLGVITDVEEQTEIIRNFYLTQNFPNPFKQSTTIRYTTVTNQWISLKVYDLFGKEIRTLVNEVKPAGTYETDFDASGIAPGIYFYKLKAGSVKETKRMIILK